MIDPLALAEKTREVVGSGENIIGSGRLPFMVELPLLTAWDVV